MTYQTTAKYIIIPSITII